VMSVPSACDWSSELSEPCARQPCWKCTTGIERSFWFFAEKQGTPQADGYQLNDG